MKRLWQIFLYFYDICVKMWLDATETLPLAEPDNKKTILLTKTGSIGDFIIWIDIAKKWCEEYNSEDFRLILICNCPPIECIFRILRLFDDIIFIDDIKCNRFLSYRQNLFKLLRQKNIDIAINGDYVNSYRNNVMFIKSLGKQVYKIGIKNEVNSWLENKKEKGFNRVVDVKPNDGTELERYARVFEAVTNKSIAASYPEIPILEDSFKREAFFVVSPNSKDLRRSWSVDKYVELIKYIYDMTRWTPVLVGGTMEIEKSEYIKEKLHIAEIEVENLTGVTSLQQTIEIIRNAKIHVGNDSGNSHIANAVRTDSFVILGGGHYEKYFPYDPNKQLKDVCQICIFKKMDCYHCDWNCYKCVGENENWPCIESISIEMARNCVKDYLNEVLKWK